MAGLIYHQKYGHYFLCLSSGNVAYKSDAISNWNNVGFKFLCIVYGQDHTFDTTRSNVGFIMSIFILHGKWQTLSNIHDHNKIRL